MIITDISPQKKKGRFNLFVDGEFYSGLGAEAIVKNQLKVGDELTKTKLEEIVSESEERAAFEKLITIVSRQMYTKFEIKQKLYKYGFSAESIESAINKAEEYKYVDDELYSKLLVDSKANKSRLEVQSMLIKKGINKDIINKQTESIDKEQEKQATLTLAEKYMKNKEVNQKTIAGLYGFLYRKGFCSESINRAIRNYKLEDFED